MKIEIINGKSIKFYCFCYSVHIAHDYIYLFIFFKIFLFAFLQIFYLIKTTFNKYISNLKKLYLLHESYVIVDEM